MHCCRVTFTPRLKYQGKSLKDDETLRQHKVEEGTADVDDFGVDFVVRFFYAGETIYTEPEFHGQYLPMGV